MVSGPGTRTGQRHFQFRLQRRRGARPVAGALVDTALGLACCICRAGCPGVYLVALLAVVLQIAGTITPHRPGGVGAASQRFAGNPVAATYVGQTVGLPPGLGVHRRLCLFCAHLVVLSLLAAEVFEPPIWP